MSEPDLTDFYRNRKPTGLPCSVGVALANLPPEKAASLRKALADPTISATAISITLNDWGVQVRHQQVRRHRIGECRCEKAAAA